MAKTRYFYESEMKILCEYFAVAAVQGSTSHSFPEHILESSRICAANAIHTRSAAKSSTISCHFSQDKPSSAQKKLLHEKSLWKQLFNFYIFNFNILLYIYFFANLQVGMSLAAKLQPKPLNNVLTGLHNSIHLRNTAV